MRRLIVLVVSVLFLSTTSAAVAAHPEFPEFIPFDASQGEFPEGVAVDKMGNVYVSLNPLGQVWKFTPTGERSLLVDFGSPGGLGLAVDAPGNVYLAREGSDNGVYKINQNGEANLVPGTDAIVFPNSLTFDKRGNLYITETFSFDAPLTEFPGCDIGAGSFFGPGGVWIVPRGGEAQLVLRHELLTGLCLPNPIPFPIGANGIAHRQGNLYVTNSEKGMVLRIPVDGHGNAGTSQVLATVSDPIDPNFGPPALDGLALDVHGAMYVPVINQSRIVRITPNGATVEQLAGPGDGLDFPASVAFGTGRGERQSLFVTNFAIGPPGGSGPGLVKLDTDKPGQPLP